MKTNTLADLVDDWRDLYRRLLVAGCTYERDATLVPTDGPLFGRHRRTASGVATVPSSTRRRSRWRMSSPSCDSRWLANGTTTRLLGPSATRPGLKGSRRR
jgi:hypothetical protein